MTAPDPDLVTIAHELSVTGSGIINASEGPANPFPLDQNLSPRQALTSVYVKLVGEANIHDRPNAPTNKDDIVGHILSLRAEVLFNQAILAAIAQHLNINVASIMAQTKESWQPNVQPPATS